jgi:hypothetical protein
MSVFRSLITQLSNEIQDQALSSEFLQFQKNACIFQIGQNLYSNLTGFKNLQGLIL